MSRCHKHSLSLSVKELEVVDQRGYFNVSFLGRREKRGHSYGIHMACPSLTRIDTKEFFLVQMNVLHLDCGGGYMTE